MASELKRCPFCGGEAELYHAEATNCWYVYCKDETGCSASIDKGFFNSKEEAIAAWNRRAKEGVDNGK